MSAKEKADYGLQFVNVEMTYGLELLCDDEEIPTWNDLVSWMSDMARNFCKFSFGYVEKSKSFTATITDRGSVKPDEKPLCLTQHGKSIESAMGKVYFLVQICGMGEVNQDRINIELDRREDYISAQLAGMIKKKVK